MASFDLEKALREWRKALFKTPGLEEGQIVELEEGLREEIEDLVAGGMGEDEAFSRAAAAMASAEVLGAEFHKVRTTRLSGRPPWQPPRFMPALLWHYLKISVRKIIRQKGFSFINIAGLSVGMACFLLMAASAQFELSYDRFHANSDRLFRVALRNDDPEIAEYSITTPQILSETMRSRIPEVENAGIIQRSKSAVLQTETDAFIEDGLVADEHFFELFSFEMLRGVPSDCLKAPDSIVLTDDTAEKIFGAEDALGKSLRYKSRFMNRDLTVSGIMRRPPRNTHLRFGYLVSAATLAADPDLAHWFGSWDSYAFSTYVELRRKNQGTVAEQKIESLVREARPQLVTRSGLVYLQPVTDIHLRSRVEGATATNNRIQSLSLFSAIALLVLLIAGINSVNLSTARAATRAREIGILKVIGAGRAQLVRQFLGESYLVTTLAMGLSLVIFYLFFPLITGFMDSGLTLNDVAKTPLILSILGIILFVGAFSGVYPALVLSVFPPASVLKDIEGSWMKGRRIRNLLVVFQFTAVVVLLIGIIVVARQLSFIRNKNLGYEREHVVIIPLNEEESVRKAQLFKTRLLELHGVLGVTVSDSDPLGLGMFVGGKSVQKENGETIKIDFHSAHVDSDFFKVYRTTIVEGRDFDREAAPGRQGVIVNETFVRMLGWKNPLDKQFLDAPVVGVVGDFHFDTLHKAIEPATFSLTGDFWGRVHIGIRIRPNDPGDMLDGIKRVFVQTVPNTPFDFHFLDDAFNQLYRNEQRLAAMIIDLEGLAILLGSMGLFGLATYSTQRRTKEIGIRKVLGASVSSIVRMMSREFVLLVLVSNLIAWPVGFFFLRQWLQGYAYRCSFGIEVFALAGLGTFLIALFAVGLHTVRAALADPIDSLRYE
jgi:putative ABC transport system permease protein